MSLNCCEDETMAMNNISKFSNITSKVLIHPGSPDIYKLKPRESFVGSVTKKTLGTKDTTKLNKTILLVGETGTGKSTLINALVNYAVGVKWEDNVWFEIIEERKRNQCESQTSDVIVYEIFGFEGKTLPYSLTIIDTPGYGDIRGNAHDSIVSHRLLELFRTEGGVHELNAVGLVLKADMNRLSDRQNYIFNAVLSLFGRDMADNIVALITHSPGMKPDNVLGALEAADIKCARNARGLPVYFLFNNCQTNDRGDDSEDSDVLEFADRITIKGMKQFSDFLNKSEPKKLQVTVDVLNERENLKVCIKNLKERVEFIESKQEEIRVKEAAVKEHKKEIENNKDYRIKTTESYKEKEDYEGGRRWFSLWLAKSGTLACIECQENCHDPCSFAWSKGGCEFIKSDHCTVCSKKCHKSRHVKESWRYVTKTRTVYQTCEEMKSKYEEGKKGQATAEGLLETLQKVMEEHQRDKDKWLEEAFQHVAKLERIALNVDSLSIHEHLDFLIQRMEEKEDETKIRILKLMKGRVDERIQAGMRYRGLGEVGTEMDESD